MFIIPIFALDVKHQFKGNLDEIMVVSPDVGGVARAPGDDDLELIGGGLLRVCGEAFDFVGGGFGCAVCRSDSVLVEARDAGVADESPMPSGFDLPSAVSANGSS